MVGQAHVGIGLGGFRTSLQLPLAPGIVDPLLSSFQ